MTEFVIEENVTSSVNILLNKNFELFLFARDEKKLEKILTQYESKNNFSISSICSLNIDI